MPLKSVATVSGLRPPGAAARLDGGVGSGTEGGWLEDAPALVASGPWLGRGPCPLLAAAAPGGVAAAIGRAALAGEAARSRGPKAAPALRAGLRP
eukprot:4584868-Alexandrium_andersonii.AAC.1